MSEVYHSEVLGLDYAVNEKTGNVHFNDLSLLTGKQVTYTPEEILIIRGTGKEITPTIHRIKSIFGGEIIREKPVKSFKDKYKNVEVF